MRICFFCPTTARSAIGRMSRLVVEELVQRGHTVTVVSTETLQPASSERHAFNTKIVPWTNRRSVARALDSCDFSLHQIGNHFPFHEGSIAWLEKCPGLVSLHDFFLGHLFWGWADRHGRDAAQSVLAKYYRKVSAADFFNHSSSDDFIEFASANAPMSAWIAGMSSGLLTHSKWDLDRILENSQVPVRTVSLPYDGPQIPGDSSAGIQEHPKPQNSHFVLLSVGHVNSNKRLHRIIEAIGLSSDLRRKVHMRIVGAITPEMRSYLTQECNRFGVASDIVGEVPADQLDLELREADLVSCLRLPTLEAASASTIEAMLYGKPVLVTDVGFYSELPNDVVCKIDPSREIVDIQAALRFMVENPTARRAMGGLASKYAAKIFSAVQYVDGLLGLACAVTAGELLKVESDRICSSLDDWGFDGTPDILKHIAEPLSVFRYGGPVTPGSVQIYSSSVGG